MTPARSSTARLIRLAGAIVDLVIALTIVGVAVFIAATEAMPDKWFQALVLCLLVAIFGHTARSDRQGDRL